ncbi:hypothetical protein ACJX0J_040648, partial [Zea mays]
MTVYKIAVTHSRSVISLALSRNTLSPDRSYVLYRDHIMKDINKYYNKGKPYNATLWSFRQIRDCIIIYNKGPIMYRVSSESTRNARITIVYLPYYMIDKKRHIKKVTGPGKTLLPDGHQYFINAYFVSRWQGLNLLVIHTGHNN